MLLAFAIARSLGRRLSSIARVASEAHQLGLGLSETEVASSATWLNSLTGDLPAEYIEQPALPGGA